MTRHEPRLRAVARRLTRDPVTADELAHEAFVRFHRSLDLFRQEAGVATWLYRTVVNLCHDHARAQAREQQHLSLDAERSLPSSAPSPDQAAEQAERTRLLDAAIQSLGEPMREVVLLRYIGGLGYDEIAEVVGCPPGTVASRIHRALQALHTLLAAQGIREDSL